MINQFEQKSKTASLLGKGALVLESLVPEAGKNKILDRYVVNRASWFSVTLPAAQVMKKFPIEQFQKIVMIIHN